MVNKNDNYGRKPIWYWILVYVILAIVIYALIYYLYLASRRDVSPYSETVTPTASQTETFTATPQRTASPLQ